MTATTAFACGGDGADAVDGYIQEHHLPQAEQKETIEDEIKHAAEANPEYFQSRCRDLTTAVAA